MEGRQQKSVGLAGLQFAPFRIPLERRLQTFALFYWMSSFLFFGLFTTAVLIYLFFYTRFWCLSLLYLAWMFYDLDTGNCGGRSGWWVRWIRGWPLWKHYRNFFPIKLVKTCDLNPSQNYLLGSHPHGEFLLFLHNQF